MPRLKKEIRTYTPNEQTSFRAVQEGDKKYLIGYAAVFNQRSKLIFENNRFFYELIDSKAFDNVLADEKLDVYLTFNHSRDKVIARTISNTLQLSIDDKGLLFKAEIPNVSYANDVYELVSRGDLFENSFGFATKRGDDEWSKDEDGNNIRLIKNISKLIDCSVVVSWAYENTTISARNTEIELERGKTITITISDNEEEIPEEKPLENSNLEIKIEDPSTATIEEKSAEEEWIGNCIKEIMDAGETDDNKQAFAICKSKWDKGERQLPNERKLQDKQDLERYRIRVQTLKLK